MAGILLLGYPANNPNRVVLNAVAGYLNLSKGFGFTPFPFNSDVNGYPSGVLPGNIGSNPSMPGNYFGQFVWKWTGAGSMQVAPYPIIVTSGGANIFEAPFSNTNASGDSAGGNVTIFSGSGGGTVTSPRIVFSFGINVQSITQSPVSNGAGGNLIRIGTKTGFATNLLTAQVMNVSGILTQTNANGTWVITVIDAQTFDLQASTWSAGQGSSGVVGQAILQAFNLSLSIHAVSGAFSGFTNLIWCKIADETAVDAGQLVDSQLISQWQYLLNPHNVPASDAWLRFMDLSGVQNSYECDFSQRIPAGYISYTPQNVRPGYWTPSTNGAISSGGAGVTYACADPSVSTWNGSSYIDNAIVQGVVDVANTGQTPTLNVGGHGAKPIFDARGDPFIIDIFSAAASAGLSMVFTFTASWMAGLPGVIGTTYTFTYTTVSGDTSVGTLRGNVKAAMAADPTLIAAKIDFANSGAVVASPRTAQAGVLTLAYTSGPAIVRIGNFYASGITGAITSTFVYNWLLDGWIYRGNPMICSVPLEVIAEMCNRVGANCWFNWGVTKGAWVTAVTGFFRDNLNAGLKFGAETGNEVWNPGANPFPIFNSLGITLGWGIGGGQAIYGYTALRTIQYQALSKAAWTTTRSASTLYTFQQAATFDSANNGNFDVYQLQGTQMNAATNTIFGSYGGLNGSGSEPSHSTYPNRPVDITTAIGMAPYWGSRWWNGSAGTIQGTTTANAPWLQASKDYANGLTTAAFASMVNQFNGTTSRPGGNLSNFSQTFSDYVTLFTSQEACCAKYDSGRGVLGLVPLAIVHYEAGPQWAMGADSVNGVNSVNATDIAALAVQMTALSWNVSAYTVSGTPNIASGTYNTSTGAVVLTLASTIAYSGAASFTGSISGNQLTVASALTGALAVGQTISGAGIPGGVTIIAFGTGTGGLGIYFISTSLSIGSQTISSGDTVVIAGLTGTGSVSSLNGTYVATPTTGGTTVSFTAATGLGSITITGGTVNDTTAGEWEAATQVITMTQAWKFDASYKNMIKQFYYQSLKTISGSNREAKASQYGYSAGEWGLFPGFYTSGGQYASYDAIHEWNA